MAIDTKSLTELITEFRAIQAKDAVSPESPGDLGRDNARRRKRWFSRKYYASVMNIRDFYADNLGRDLADTVSNALTRDISRRFVT